jgi:alpha-galactosidase
MVGDLNHSIREPTMRNHLLHVRRTTILVALVLCGSWTAAAMAAETVLLTSLDLSKMRQGYGQPQIDRSIREQPLAIGGKAFRNGVGTHANSKLWIDLAGGSERFLASVGVDDAAGGPATIVFQVLADGRTVWESGVMKPGDPAKTIDLDVRGAKYLLLVVNDAGDGINFDHADWADARLVVSGQRPKTVLGPQEEAFILTPKPSPAPRINGPKVFGCRPGHPFLYRIPTTGQRPIAFSAEGLPEGLKLDPQSGIITGTVPSQGEYVVTLYASNEQGKAERTLQIVAGDLLALTPPMGWNHWYAHYDRVTDKLMREAADAMIATGMADVGYQYVNIDDCWANAPRQGDPRRVGPLRDAQGNVLPNKHFPDMKALTDYIHAKGLKAGIYTSPGPLTCAGFAGAYQHEEQDARQFAAWGFDFLKYDWCSYGQVTKGDNSPAALKKPYQQMGDLLRQQNRDMVYNLCQYGMGNVWEWGAEVGGHSWRTAGDLGMELDRIFEVALANAAHRDYSRPGSWNDPDYIQIGHIGDAGTGGQPRPCGITPSEQYAFMSLWCLMASPLFFSGDMNQLDEFTLNILCNPEVIEIDQDPLGQCGRVIAVGEQTFLMVKDLEDGGKAVGLCNRGELPATVTARWSDLGLKGPQTVRDPWRQKDLGHVDGEFSASVLRRGVVLVRMTAVGKSGG